METSHNNVIRYVDLGECVPISIVNFDISEYIVDLTQTITNTKPDRNDEYRGKAYNRLQKSLISFNPCRL